MVIASLPLLALFFMGIYSVVLVLRLDDEYEQRKKDEAAFREREQARIENERLRRREDPN